MSNKYNASFIYMLMHAVLSGSCSNLHSYVNFLRINRFLINPLIVPAPCKDIHIVNNDLLP